MQRIWYFGVTIRKCYVDIVWRLFIVTSFPNLTTQRKESSGMVATREVPPRMIQVWLLLNSRI